MELFLYIYTEKGLKIAKNKTMKIRLKLKGKGSFERGVERIIYHLDTLLLFIVFHFAFWVAELPRYSTQPFRITCVLKKKTKKKQRRHKQSNYSLFSISRSDSFNAFILRNRIKTTGRAAKFCKMVILHYPLNFRLRPIIDCFSVVFPEITVEIFVS